MREKIVQQLYNSLLIKWIPSQNFSDITESVLSGKRGSITFYNEGSVYYGMPFIQSYVVSYEEFCNRIHKGVLFVPENKEFWVGGDCTSVITDAVRKYTALPFKKFYSTKDFLEDRELIKELKGKDIYEGYALLLPADILSSYTTLSMPGGRTWLCDHTRMVTGYPVVKRDTDGHIIPKESYVIVTENTVFKTDTSDENNIGGKITGADVVVPYVKDEWTDIQAFCELKGKNITAKFNRKISFYELERTGFVPLRFRGL